MARPLRIEFDGALYHVMSRGNERRPIVRDEADRWRRIDWLRRTVETYRWRLHAFVLMTNHDHLFIETPAANLSEGMQCLNGSYSGYFNARHRRVGHLFQGRFKAQLVEQKGHYHEISRYLHLNPCRVRNHQVLTTSQLTKYSWSSYPGYHRATKKLEWVTYDRVLADFGPGSAAARRRRYRAFVRAGMAESDESPLERAVQGLIVGSDRFVEQIRVRLDHRPSDATIRELNALQSKPELTQIIKAVHTQFNMRHARWQSGSRSDDASRAVAAYLARHRFGYPANVVAHVLGYGHASSVAHAVRRIRSSSQALRRTVRRIEKDLSPR